MTRLVEVPGRTRRPRVLAAVQFAWGYWARSGDGESLSAARGVAGAFGCTVSEEAGVVVVRQADRRIIGRFTEVSAEVGELPSTEPVATPLLDAVRLVV